MNNELCGGKLSFLLFFYSCHCVASTWLFTDSSKLNLTFYGAWTEAPMKLIELSYNRYMPYGLFIVQLKTPSF